MISPGGALSTENSSLVDPCNLTRAEAESLSLEDAFFIRQCLVQAIKSRDGYMNAWYHDRELLNTSILYYEQELENIGGHENSTGYLEGKIEALEEYKKNTQGRI